MPLTPTTGAVYDLQAGPRRASPANVDNTLKIAKFTYTATAAGQGSAVIGVLPVQNVRVFADLSRIIAPDGANATSVVSVGTGAYTQPDGTAVSASNTEFVSAAAYGGGAIDAAFTTPAAFAKDFLSRDGLPINITIATADIAIGEEIIVYVAYADIAS